MSREKVEQRRTSADSLSSERDRRVFTVWDELERSALYHNGKLVSFSQLLSLELLSSRINIFAISERSSFYQLTHVCTHCVHPMNKSHIILTYL